MGDTFGQQRLLRRQFLDLLFVCPDESIAVGFRDALKKLVDLLFNGGNVLAQRCALILR
ncbi:hypothetical protein [Shinella sp. JR1-6]|uniref:hypothetical protein n=1 Tax=Shinella sp. JR1-6 TaxID=2527671 RepID=UPI001A9CB99F|nr:hypothetical protein [Shinella sp. JR1-6]